MKNKWAIAAGMIIAAAVIVAVILMMSRDSQSAQYRIEDNQLVINCSFGVSVPLDEIDGLTLTNAAPEIETKTNGAGIGTMYKGEYKLTDGSDARLFIDASVPPFICFTQGDTVFYLNTESSEATQALYDEIQTALS